MLDRDGGVLPVLANLTRWFLGGAAGSGKQYISWIHLADLMQMFLQAMEPENFPAGAYNAVAPHPATNAKFMLALRHHFSRPWCPPAPVWAVKRVLRLIQTEPTLILQGCRCAPKRFMESGFKFQFPDLLGAFGKYLPDRVIAGREPKTGCGFAATVTLREVLAARNGESQITVPCGSDRVFGDDDDAVADVIASW